MRDLREKRKIKEKHERTVSYHSYLTAKGRGQPRGLREGESENDDVAVAVACPFSAIHFVDITSLTSTQRHVK